MAQFCMDGGRPGLGLAGPGRVVESRLLGQLSRLGLLSTNKFLVSNFRLEKAAYVSSPRV